MISSCPIQEGLLFEMNHKSNNRYINGTTLSYGVVHILYWTIFCLMVAFASAFLLSRGLSSSRIGLILGVSYLLSALLQPVTGAFFSRHNIPRSRGIAVIYIPVALITVAIRFLPLSGNAVGACMIVLVTVQSMMQPSVNALYQSIETKEEPVNFGMARGMGSVAYALSSFFAGRLLKIFDPSILPLMYLTAQLLLIAVLFLIRDNGAVVKSRDRGGNMSYGEMLNRYSHLRFFVLGMICLFLTYSFIDSFLVQIILSIGGTTSDLGTAIMFAAILEMPAMVIYAWICRKGRGMEVFQISMWIWLAKDILMVFVRTPQQLFLVQIMGCACCAIYVPGMMHYMSKSLPPSQLLRGATMAGTATTLGSLIATLVGGWMIDHAGVHTSLILVQIPAVAGTLLMNAAIIRARKTGHVAKEKT